MLTVRLLGSVEVAGDDGTRLALGGAKPLAVLSALVVHLGEVLSTQRLVDLVWEEHAPATASALVASHVAAVRRALAPAGAASAIRTRAPGYVAELEPAQVDARRFEDLVADGRRRAAEGRSDEAARLLSEALGLWRGRDALLGLDQTFARNEATRLRELRLAAQEDRFELDLRLGRADEAVAPLLAHLADHPLRERPRAQLMTALSRLGRTWDALHVYREGRAVLRAELGLDPGPELRALHQEILEQDGGPAPVPPPQPGVPVRGRGPAAPDRPGPAPLADGGPTDGGPAPERWPATGHAPVAPHAPPAPDPGGTGRVPPAHPRDVAPSQLPPDVSDFVGRARQVAWAAALLERTDEPDRTAPPVGVISGRPGTGKTALAVHVGHRAAGLFPDGRLFLDLRASDTAPLETADALARLLRALGVDPGTVSGGLDDLIGLYRTRVTGRRILLVLDNALSEAALRPLLPPGPGSAVLVTSRRRLVALEGAVHLDLAVPDEAEAVRLLAAAAGRPAAGPATADLAEITALCGRLPLALRIAGARLAARPHWPPARLAERLRDERRRLNELRVGDLEVRASLELGYADLDPADRRALRRLALLDLPDFASWVAAPLLGIGAEEAEESVERLVDRHFVDVLGVDGTGQTRFRIHDLAREHARERCVSEEDPGERTAAVLRLVDCWLALAARAAAHGPGGVSRFFRTAPAACPLDPGTQEALLASPTAWFAAEQAGLVAAVAYCADQGLTRAARDLAGALIASSAALYNQFEAWSRSHTVALEAVRRGGDGEGEAWLLAGLGQLRYEQDRFEEAYAYFAQAHRLFDAEAPAGRRADADPPAGGEVPADAPSATDAPAAADALRGAATALAGMGVVRREQARYAEALELLEAAAGRYRALGDDAGTARALYGLGYVHREQGRAAEAWRTLTRARALYRRAGDRHGEALTLRSLALCHRASGALADAAELLAEALRIFRELDDRFGATYTEQSLAKVELRQGHLERARRRLGRCLEVARDRQDAFGEALVLRTLGEWHLAAGDPVGAGEPLRRSLAAWEALGLPLWRARVLRDLARVHDALGEDRAAAEARDRAREVFLVLGSREAHEEP